MARKGKKKPSNNKTKAAASSWDSLPRDMFEMIFKNLSTGDRVRVGAVCKYWNHVASEAKSKIPQIPEAPWEILSEDSYAFPEPFITQVRLKSLSESRIYRFKLPDNHDQGWLCGSSRGWLLMACGDKLDPDLLLWNPVKGLSRNLPPLSTHPLYERFVKSIQEGDVDNVSCLFHRLQVFPHDSLGWAVAAIIFNKLGHYTNRISFCTSQGERWTTYEAEHPKYYVDIMFHEKKDTLFVLIKTTSGDSVEDGLLSPKEAHLSAGCTVRLSFILISVLEHDDDMMLSEGNRHNGWTCYTFERAKLVWRLVEHDDGAIVVGTQLDCVRRDRADGEMTVCYSTRHVSFVSENVTSIGNQTIFFGSTSTNPIIVSGPLEGIEAGCVYLATDDSLGRFSDNEQYSIRENAIYFLKDRKMRRSSRTFARYPPPGKIGWLEPKLN